MLGYITAGVGVEVGVGNGLIVGVVVGNGVEVFAGIVGGGVKVAIFNRS